MKARSLLFALPLLLAAAPYAFAGSDSVQEDTGSRSEKKRDKRDDELVEDGDELKVIERGNCRIHSQERDEQGLELVIANCVWAVPAAVVIELISNPADFASFLDSVEESVVLADGRVMQVHSARGLRDRQVTVTFDNRDLPDGGFRSEWVKASKQEPVPEDRVEVERNEGWWEIHSDGPSVSRVQYAVRYDASGIVKPRVQRFFQKRGLADAMQQFEKAAQRSHR